MMDRRTFSRCVLGTLTTWPIVLHAQTPGGTRRVGILGAGDPPAGAALPSPFIRGLEELGYIFGRNLVIEERYAGGQLNRLPELAAELARLPVDVIIVGGPTPLNAARAATSTIPIVMVAASSDPVGEGIVASLAKPRSPC
jgi:putative tryptophan/tyrosine transport system substrate-binding protein